MPAINPATLAPGQQLRVYILPLKELFGNPVNLRITVREGRIVEARDADPR